MFVIQLEDKTKSVPAGDRTKAEPKEERAINVDINTPVDDFTLIFTWYLFIQLEDKTKSVPAGDKAKAEPKEEWAINVDINTPVDDFTLIFTLVFVYTARRQDKVSTSRR